MAIKPKDLLNNKKDLNKILDFDKISLNEVSMRDLTFNGDNYDEFINLNSFLYHVSSCQISDAFDEVTHKSCVISRLKSVNNLKTWGRITTAKTDCNDWGTITLAIDESKVNDVLFVETSDMDAAIWGELASVCAKNSKIKATVVYGCVRDLDALLTMDYPIFACDFRPNAGKALGLGEININLNIENISISPGDFLFGDETGVVIIPEQFFNEVMLQTLQIKLKENLISETLNSGKSLSQVVNLK